MNNNYFQDGIQEILRQAQERNQDMNPEMNMGLSPEQTLEQNLINQILDVRSLEIKGKFIVDNNNVPISLQIKGTMMSKEGYPVSFENELFFTMSDGTSLGEYVECMNCAEIVHKSNISRCPVCGKTVCILCNTSSKSGKQYCSSWHKFLGGDTLL
jgi:hypothetical protein